MERFIRRRNIERYRRLLAQTTDEAERRLIASLLAAEEARDAVGGTSDSPTTQNP